MKLTVNLQVQHSVQINVFYRLLLDKRFPKYNTQRATELKPKVKMIVITSTFITGTDSPVNIDSSTMAGPLNSNKSQGINLSSTDRPKCSQQKQQTNVSGFSQCRRAFFFLLFRFKFSLTDGNNVTREKFGTQNGSPFPVSVSLKQQIDLQF